MTTLLQKHYGRLKGRVAWILGGRRIGRVVARALAEQGVHLAVNYFHSQREAEATVEEARRLGVRAITTQSDASRRESVAAAVEQMSATFPRVDILVNMPSVFQAVKLADIQPQDWAENIAAHLLGSFWPVQCVLPRLSPGAHVINISDRTSIGPVYPDYLPYVVTKGAVHHLTRALAKELAPRGIFVNGIAPGPVLPPDSFAPEMVKEIRQQSPLKVPVDSEETTEQFALLVLYLSVVTLTSGWTYSLDQGQNL